MEEVKASERRRDREGGLWGSEPTSVNPGSLVKQGENIKDWENLQKATGREEGKVYPDKVRQRIEWNDAELAMYLDLKWAQNNAMQQMPKSMKLNVAKCADDKEESIISMGEGRQQVE